MPGVLSSVDNPVGDGRWLVELAQSVNARAMVRCGISLYGYCLPIDGAAQPRIRTKLQPVMTWKTHVIDVRDVAAGETVGYNAMFTATSPMRLALLAAGYSDGLRRSLSSSNAKAGGWVMIGGKRAAIVGRISMNLTLVDVTGIDGVAGGRRGSAAGRWRYSGRSRAAGGDDLVRDSVWRSDGLKKRITEITGKLRELRELFEAAEGRGVVSFGMRIRIGSALLAAVFLVSGTACVAQAPASVASRSPLRMRCLKRFIRRN